jgi:hypothetical protein
MGRGAVRLITSVLPDALDARENMANLRPYPVALGKLQVEVSGMASGARRA